MKIMVVGQSFYSNVNFKRIFYIPQKIYEKVKSLCSSLEQRFNNINSFDELGVRTCIMEIYVVGI